MTVKRKYLSLLLLIILMITAAGSALGDSIDSNPGVDDFTIIDLSTAIEVNLNDYQDVFLISKSGIYVLTGTLNGRVQIKASKADVVGLVMSNAHIINPAGPAIEGSQARQVVLILEEETHSTVSSGSELSADQKDMKAAIDIGTDLVIGAIGNASGSLEVISPTGHGILCKGNLKITGGHINISSLGDGLCGKDSVHIVAGEISIVSGADGIVSTSSKEGQGIVSIDGGNFTITAGQDGIQTESSLLIAGGSFDIFTGNGGTSVNFVGDESVVSDQQNAFSNSKTQRSSLIAQTIVENSDKSKKGFKANTSIMIDGGVFILNTEDDAISSKGDIVIDGGDFAILTGDDGIQTQEHLQIKSGNISIIGCYEGIESKTVTIDGGNITITSSDDGINAAHPEGKSEIYQDQVWVVINSGNIKIRSGIDAIDTNGTLTITGGVVDLAIKYFGKGNAAIDTDGGYFYTGGQVTTNDGSEKAIGPK